MFVLEEGHVCHSVAFSLPLRRVADVGSDEIVPPVDGERRAAVDRDVQLPVRVTCGYRCVLVLGSGVGIIGQESPVSPIVLAFWPCLELKKKNHQI